MAILRVRKSRFSVVSTEMLERTDMSWKAKGLLCYMLSRPDDWRFSERSLYARFPGGKGLTASGLKELEGLGYLDRGQATDEGGRFSKAVWTVREDPSEPWSKNPTSGKPTSENPQLLNTDRDLILKEPNKNLRNASHSLSGKPDGGAPRTEESEDRRRAREAAMAAVSRLNELTGSKYRPNSEATVSRVHARLREGYDTSDLVSVVELKCAEWANDPRLRRYLRPETLFGRTKFESYVNEVHQRAAAGSFLGNGSDLYDF